MTYTPKIGKKDLNLEDNSIPASKIIGDIPMSKFTFSRTATTGITYTPVIDNTYVGVKAGTTAVQMPTGVEGKMMVIKDEDGGSQAAPITITPAAPQTIDGQTSIVFGINYGSLTLLFSGGHWRII